MKFPKFTHFSACSADFQIYKKCFRPRALSSAKSTASCLNLATSGSGPNLSKRGIITEFSLNSSRELSSTILRAPCRWVELITLTVKADARPGIDEISKYKRNLLDFLRRHIKDFKYVIKNEFQKNGVVHFHLLTSHNVGHLVKGYWQTREYGRYCQVEPLPEQSESDSKYKCSIEKVAYYFAKKNQQTDTPQFILEQIKERWAMPASERKRKGCGFRFWTCSRNLIKDLDYTIDANSTCTPESIPGFGPEDPKWTSEVSEKHAAKLKPIFIENILLDVQHPKAQQGSLLCANYFKKLKFYADFFKREIRNGFKRTRSASDREYETYHKLKKLLCNGMKVLRLSSRAIKEKWLNSLADLAFIFRAGLKNSLEGLIRGWFDRNPGVRDQTQQWFLTFKRKRVVRLAHFNDNQIVDNSYIGSNFPGFEESASNEDLVNEKENKTRGPQGPLRIKAHKSSKVISKKALKGKSEDPAPEDDYNPYE